jgi:hypothetical protein
MGAIIRLRKGGSANERIKDGRRSDLSAGCPTAIHDDLACEASGLDPGSKSAAKMGIQYARARDLLRAWDFDLWHLSHSPIKSDLKPLTPEELEGLDNRFPDVLHIYVTPDVVLFETAASEAALLEVLRRDLVFRGEMQIHARARDGVDISEWCGGEKGAVHVLAFNTLRVRAILQRLALESQRS